MGYLCEFCENSRSIVYCPSDMASLCLSCDSTVHSANSLSKRHTRTLVCERCYSKPASLRCIDERITLCQDCDLMVHVGSNMTISHKKHAIDFYSDCPSALELSSSWPFLLDSPSVGSSTSEQGIGSMTIADTRRVDPRPPQVNSNVQYPTFLDEVTEPPIVDRLAVRKESYPPMLDPMVHNTDQPGESNSLAIPKVLSSEVKGTGIFEENAFGDDYTVDEADFTIESYEEVFGSALNHPEQLLKNDGIDELFGMKAMSQSHGLGGYPPEGSSVGGPNLMQPAFSNAASADSIISCKTEPNLCFTKQAYSGLSFSSLTGESCAGDYQDYGASKLFLMGEPPWFPPVVETAATSSSRKDAVKRYQEKKKARKFEKTVRYESRKARADVRKRVKGRFIKAGDAYDYDPLGKT